MPPDNIGGSPPDATGIHYNRLFDENIWILLQHASNPVDWYRWGDEAFTLRPEGR